MNSLNKISLILFIGFVSCTDSDNGVLTEDQNNWLIEAKAILQGNLSEPDKSLHLVNHYRGESESSMTSYRRIFYDDVEREVLNLGFSADNDTISVQFTHYGQRGEIIERKHYQYPDWQNKPDLNGGGLDKLKWISTNIYNYDNDGKLIRRESLLSNSEKQSGIISHYNDSGQLVAEEYFLNDESIDWHIYEYGDDERIHKETWRFSRDEPPYRTYFYTYNDNDLLIAKETGELYNPEPEKTDVHQYFYDNMNRLIEEKEYYPNMGFQLFFRKTYKYHD